MFRTTALLIILLAGLSVWADDTAAPSEDKQLQEDRAAIEGLWRRTFRDKSGRELTTTKIERAGKSTVTVRDADGNKLHEHHSDYELQRSGEVRIFKYSNRTVTHGPDAGQVDPRPRRYIYRITGDRFYEIHGVLTDDERAPTIFIWERVDTTDEVTSL
jgi:hypothetical protein